MCSTRPHPLLHRFATIVLAGCAQVGLFAQPVNDSCSNVVPVVILTGASHLFTGDNTGGTFPGDAVPGSSWASGSFPLVWHSFILQDCGNVTVDYCGNTPMQSVVSSALSTTCPADDPVILADAQNSTVCGDGNATLTYLFLPAGQYYIPIYCVFSPIGPYLVQVTVLPCSGGPANDECTGAYPLQVNSPLDCPGSASFGNTSLGTQSTPAPSCLAGLPYADVWYHFNSAADTLVEVHAEAITASEIGIEVIDSCGGTSILCAIGMVINDTLHVAAATDHWIRVFTQTDTEVPGTFGICLNRLAPPVLCDGGQVTTSDGFSTIAICKEGVADPMAFNNTSTSTESYAYFLCDTAGIVLAALNGDSLNPDTLALGSYQIYGFSNNGGVELPFIGEPIDSLTAVGACGELSADSVALSVEICSGVAGAVLPVLRVHPNPNDGHFMIDLGAGNAERIVQLLDLSGRAVFATTLEQDRSMINLPDDVANGTYLLLLARKEGPHTARVVVQR